MKVLLPLAACALLGGCAVYGDPYYYGSDYYGSGYYGSGYGYAYPSASVSVYQGYPGYGGGHPAYGRGWRDRDRDNDGVPNAWDRRPNNPRWR